MSIQERVSGIDFKITLLPCLLVFSFFLYKSIHYPIHDFANSYFPAKFFVQGKFDKTVFDPYLFNKKIAGTGTEGVFASFNPNPPSVGLLFSPLTIVDVHSAKLIFNGISICFFLLSIYRICKYVGIPSTWVYLLLPIVFFIPLRNNILFGQTYLLLTSLLIEGFLAYEKKNVWISSLWWSFAIFVKIFPLVIFLFLFIRKEHKQASILFGVCLLLLISFVWLQGMDVWGYYLVEVLPRSSAGDLNSAYTTGTQSALMLFKFLFVSDEVFNVHSLLNSSTIFFITTGMFTSLVLSLGVSAIKNDNKWFALALLLLCAQLMSPQGSSYSIILLLLMLIAMYPLKSEKIYWISLALVFLMANIPISIFQSLPLIFRFPRLLLLITFFVVVVFTFKIRLNLQWFIILFLLITTPKVINYLSETDASTRYVDTEMKSLIIDYSEKNRHLYYTYWSEQGEKVMETTIQIDLLTDSNVSILDNQLFYQDRQLTHSSDNKKKAMMINSKEIIYLSDKGKGIGFYAIRKINAP